MEKSIAKIIKEVRLLNHLTQKQFAKKYFITEQTVSNYETGQRTPDIEFLKKLCDDFNLSLDYFLTDIKEASNPKDLIVTKKGDKYAIYDKSKSIYLTPNLYDGIRLSENGYQIVYTLDKEKLINYSAIVDNYGNVTSYPNLVFGYNGIFYVDVCPALNKLTRKVHLVNYNGEVLSKGYTKIVPVNPHHGLYMGINFSRNENDEVMVDSFALLNNDGKEIKATFDRPLYDLDQPKIKELSDINNIVSMMKKYGANILNFIPSGTLKNGYDYYLILKAISEFETTHTTPDNELLYIASSLSSIADIEQPNLNEEDEAKINLDDIKIKAKNRIESTFTKKHIQQLLDKIGVKNIYY